MAGERVSMNWIKIEDYLPGSSRPIQIWGCKKAPVFNGKPENHYGYFANGNFYSFKDSEQLINVTHWADMLRQPEK